MSFSILGTGSAKPSQCKTNHDLAEIMDTNDEWIQSKTGIRERCLLGEETITDLAVESAKQALSDGGVKAQELDLIICATVTPDFITPSMACVVQRRIGARCPAFDLNAACAGFLYAWDVAMGYFERNPDSRILIIGAEAVSKLVDWKERSTAVIFADGAGAVVLGKGEGLLSIKLNAKGNEEFLYANNLEGNCPFRKLKKKDNHLHMDGQEVFRFAVSSMCRDLKAVAMEAGLALKEVDFVLPHQANMRIIDFAIRKLDIEREKFLVNIERRGNTSAAAIPVLLDEFCQKKQFKKGDVLAFSSFGAGLTSAACILRWDK